MFEKIKGVKIKSSIFDSETQLDLFYGDYEGKSSVKNDRVSLLFGRNGSGKSTLARGINQIRTDKGEAESIAFIDKNNVEITLGKRDKQSIFVFNEGYIDTTIKFAQDSLGTIVILGEQINIDNQIINLQKELSQYSSKLNRCELELNKFSDINDVQSPNYWKKKIDDSLKGKHHWADRDREIRGNRAATPVHEKTYEKIVELNPSRSKEELFKDFEDGKQRYLSLGENSIPLSEIQHIDIEFDKNLVSKLLSQKIEEPQLTNRDKYLLSLLSSFRGEPYLKEIEAFFKVEDNKECRFCTQSIPSNVREELLAGISRLLSKEVIEHQNLLSQNKLKYVEINCSSYEQLDESLLKELSLHVEKLNGKFDKINRIIEGKIKNPYTPIGHADLDFFTELTNLKNSINRANKNIEEYNNFISDKSKLQSRLIDINNKIAHYEILDDYKKYKEKVKEKTKCSEKFTRIANQVSSIKQEITSLENKKLNIDIAVNEINRYLSYIFYSKDRITIENRDGKYFLLSRGCPVKPDKISIGERNALALCYFFTEIIGDKSLITAYGDEYFLVLDDPISSFDLENKIGIISFLKFCLNKFIQGNKYTRVLLMTHDSQTMYDFDKFLQEIMENRKKNEGGAVSHYKRLELSKGVLKEYRIKAHGYTELLEIVYDYAVSESSDHLDSFVGNAMRKVLEAYGSFTYKQGIDKLTTEESVMARVDSRYRSYFEHLMYRLVLHNESHYEDDVKTLNLDFFDNISHTERQKTARDLLVLLYLFDDLHVLTHLQSKRDAKVMIEQWRDAID